MAKSNLSSLTSGRYSVPMLQEVVTTGQVLVSMATSNLFPKHRCTISTRVQLFSFKLLFLAQICCNHTLHKRSMLWMTPAYRGKTLWNCQADPSYSPYLAEHTFNLHIQTLTWLAGPPQTLCRGHENRTSTCTILYVNRKSVGVQAAAQNVATGCMTADLTVTLSVRHSVMPRQSFHLCQSWKPSQAHAWEGAKWQSALGFCMWTRKMTSFSPLDVQSPTLHSGMYE